MSMFFNFNSHKCLIRSCARSSVSLTNNNSNNNNNRGDEDEDNVFCDAEEHECTLEMHAGPI